MRDYDIESDLKQEKFQSLKLVQGDRGNKIKINVYEDGQPVSLTGCSISAKYKRADGEVVNDRTIENITDNYFYAVIDSNITKVSGTLKMLFSIEKDDVKVSTFLLLADVREGIGESTGGSTGGSTGSGEVTVDLSNYYKKNETYSKSQIDSQFKDIANELGRDSNSNPIDMGTTATTIRGAIKEIKDNSNGNLTDEQIETAITAYLGKHPITGGLTSSQLSALNNMFKVCAYTKQDISTEYDAFKTAFGISSGDTPITKQYTITNNLSNCKNSNSNTSIKENTSYVATITADSGYIINQITVMMDGKDITDTAVADSTIHITSVTGNIIITVTTTGSEPQPSLLYNWDLTNSLTDTVSNKEARLVGTTSEGTISSDGLTLGVSNAVGIVIDCDIVGKKIEFDLGDCPSRDTTTRAFVFGGANAETLSIGLLYKNGYWTPYNASGWGDATTYSDSQMFNNSTVTIEIDSNCNAVFKFNDEIITTVILNNSNIQTFGFGSKSQSWIGSIVKAVRVYQM